MNQISNDKDSLFVSVGAANCINSDGKTLFRNPWLELAARWFLGLTFLYASYHKIIAPAHFAKIVYGYYLFPHVTINLIAIILPFIELSAAVALILGAYPRSAALIVIGMLTGFVIVLSINLIRGQEFDCGCFSFGDPGHSSPAGQLLIRDIIYLIAGIEVLLFDGRRLWCIWNVKGQHRLKTM
jgi:putative oxidoreductase